MAPDNAPPAGDVVAERYRLGKPVGEGGMAEVWMADDLKLHRHVAVKLLSSAMRSKPDVKERLKAEARSAAKLNHPNVVAVYDTGEHQGVPFLVMELLSGRTLADELKKGPMDQKRLLAIISQALEGLDAAHGVGIVHRDIKPANILFTADGNTVKVADFGIAKGTEGMDVTQTGMLMGTPAYLSPEQVAGERATAASDLYSLGVVMYEALAGRQPHEAETVVALANKIHSQEPPGLTTVRSDIDPRLAALVHKAMAKDPGQRYKSAREMAQALARVMSAGASVESDDRTMIAPAPPEVSDRTQVLTARRSVRDDQVAAGGRGGLSRPVKLAIALSVLALVLLVGVVAWQSLNLGAPTRPDPPPRDPVTEGSPLPSPLESSLRRLEEAVRQ